MSDLKNIQNDYSAKLNINLSLEEINQIKTELFGKNGLISSQFKNIASIPEADRNKITEDIEELKKVKDGEDLEAIKSKTEALVQSSLKMGEAIYKQNPQGAGPQPDPSGAEPSADNTKDEKVVDAEFEEVDEDKKD